MSCSNVAPFKENKYKCVDIGFNNVRSIYVDMKTSKVYDENKDFLGYGKFENGILQISKNETK